MDKPTAEVIVLTFKEGLLSRVAHDLKLRAERVSVEVDAAARTVEASIDARALRVVCAMSDGREAHGTLSAGDTRKIEQSLASDVLDSARFPTITFRSDPLALHGGAATVSGALTLHGVTRAVQTQARLVGGLWTARFDLHQPDFGVRPFSAMMGALRVKAAVQIHVAVPHREEWGDGG